MTSVMGRTEEVPELRELLERRRNLGLDTHDEIWNGTYVIMPNPAPEHGEVVVNVASFLKAMVAELELSFLSVAAPVNIGRFGEDYRVPDVAVYDRSGDRTSPAFLGQSAAWLVVEVLSAGEEADAKFDFYHRYGVQEILIIDWQAARSELWARSASLVRPFLRADKSSVLKGLFVIEGVLCHRSSPVTLRDE